MKAFYFIAVIAAVAVSTDAASVIQEEHPVPWYNCVGKADGNYLHPSDCTRFMSCSGGVASQRDCANCFVDAVRCPQGRLVYNATQDACDWADQTRCEVDGSSTIPTSAPTSETEASDEPTEEATTPQATTPPPNGNPVEGGPCNPKECLLTGWCKDYFRCNNVTNTWEKVECGNNTLWNDLDSNGNAHIHGGNCDLWKNLLQVTKDKYRNSKDCLECYWKEKGECSQSYWYQPANLTYPNRRELLCGQDMVFVESMETCQRCDLVDKKDGSGKCCNSINEGTV